MPKLYAVIGRGEFPTDMLRRDQSDYVSEAEKHVADDYYNPHERTVLLMIEDGCRSRPNEERWQSFGWRVVQNDMRLPSFPPGPRGPTMPGGENYHDLMQQIRTLRAALRPFADRAARYDGNRPADLIGLDAGLNVGHMRTAQAALSARN